jgi:phosphatidylglycerophosphatase A
VTPAHLVATFGGIGHLRPAPGTWGSIAALPVALVLYLAGGPWLLLACAILAFGAGLWATGHVMRATGDSDPQIVVIDEVAGQWVALLPVAFGAAHVAAPVTALWPGWLAAFLLFRLFDIWKPWVIGRADRRGDALGVMLDDVLAGIAAGLSVMLLAALAHGVFME